MAHYPTAVVMNMFYTGLGIARSLGERGIPVIGLSSQPRLYGNATRYAECLLSPDSKNDPERLLEFLLQLARRLQGRAVLFPTRDHDVVFLDRYRDILDPHFSLVIPGRAALAIALNKWETCRHAKIAGIPSPSCWMVENPRDLSSVLPQITYPCVLKPVEAHHWRTGTSWALVGARKAIAVSSEAELLSEYNAVQQADSRVLIQELIPGGDDCLVICACYFDQSSRYAASFYTRKLVQIPEGFGTGCIVQTTHQPELLAPTIRLLESIGYSGVAEVEYKWHAGKQEYQLIEINPRPWDQHSLGRAAGTDLIYFAYCDHAGLAAPGSARHATAVKWVAEDVFVMTMLRLLRRRDIGGMRALVAKASGRRTYGIWSLHDPLPGFVYLFARLIPDLASAAVTLLRRSARPVKEGVDPKQGEVYERHYQKGNG